MSLAADHADSQSGGSYVSYGFDGNDDPNRSSTPPGYSKMCHGELNLPLICEADDRWRWYTTWQKHSKSFSTTLGDKLRVVWAISPQSKGYPHTSSINWRKKLWMRFSMRCWVVRETKKQKRGSGRCGM